MLLMGKCLTIIHIEVAFSLSIPIGIDIKSDIVSKRMQEAHFIGVLQDWKDRTSFDPNALL